MSIKHIFNTIAEKTPQWSHIKSHITLKSYINFGQTVTNTSRMSGYNNPVCITNKGLKILETKKMIIMIGLHINSTLIPIN